MEKPAVFIGSSTAALATADRVKTELSTVARVVLWNENVFGLSRGTFESLLEALENFDFAILLFTPDEPLVHAGLPVFKPRDNVLIEFGLFTGALGRDRTFVMRPFHGSLHMPTDLAGVTVAPLKPAKDEEQQYDIKDGCAKIIAAIKSRGHRPRLIDELGVLYRLVNAFTFPHYRNVHVPVFRKARVTVRPHETFDRVDEVIGFLGELLSDYVYPQLNPDQLESMRIYFAYYLADGLAEYPEGTNWRSCRDKDSNADEFDGEFVIGLANPAEMVSERDWRVGRGIKGFSGLFPESMCARVFNVGQMEGFHDATKLPQGMPNYETPDERSVFSFPVEWRSEEGAGRIGVITISAREANSISDEIKTLVDLLANIVGFLFSLYAVGHRRELEREGAVSLGNDRPMRGFSKLPDSDAGKRFATAVAGLRRVIAGHFERAMIAQGRHASKDGNLYCTSMENRLQDGVR